MTRLTPLHGFKKASCPCRFPTYLNGTFFVIGNGWRSGPTGRRDCGSRQLNLVRPNTRSAVLPNSSRTVRKQALSLAQRTFEIYGMDRAFGRSAPVLQPRCMKYLDRTGMRPNVSVALPPQVPA